MSTQTENRLRLRLDERARIHTNHEELLKEAGDNDLSDMQKQQAQAFRERAVELDTEIADLEESRDRDAEAAQRSQAIRRALAGNAGMEGTDDDVGYRTMAAYARDMILTGSGREVSKIAAQIPVAERQAAEQRLEIAMRLPANTLSSNVAGLIPEQHISQIFQVINKSRPIVDSAMRADLNRGALTFPVITTPPVVAIQNTQKTEAGNTGMVIDMVTATASTYLGGGDLSWQAINWSTPNALELWFDLVAADYALKTETDAATVVSASAFLNNIASTIATSASFAQFMTGIGAGVAEVWANSGRIANTIYLAPDRYGYLLGLTSDAFAQFTSVGTSGIGPLSVVVSRGLNAGEIIVGDRAGLLVAETPGAPVELRVVEPAIGGVEVGLIGAFEAVVVDDGAFAAVSTAS